ncbi:MAG TPA: hypothetical protein VMV47_05570 [Bacteroidales bacterium]|nr:hypothetical protein [Bacteroidales bacterium]
MKNIDQIPGKNPFKVPENYFKEVNSKIISVTTGETDMPVRNGLYRKIRPYLLAAATVTGFIIISYVAAKIITNHRKVPETIFAQTMTMPYINDIDIYSIEESIENLDLTDGLQGIKNADIVDYLMHENIEADAIIEML